MNWEDMLEKAAYWSKYLLLGYCVGYTLVSFGSLPTSNVVLVTGATGLVVADWVNRYRK